MRLPWLLFLGLASIAATGCATDDSARATAPAETRILRPELDGMTSAEAWAALDRSSPGSAAAMEGDAARVLSTAELPGDALDRLVSSSSTTIAEMLPRWYDRLYDEADIPETDRGRMILLAGSFRIDGTEWRNPRHERSLREIQARMLENRAITDRFEVRRNVTPPQRDDPSLPSWERESGRFGPGEALALNGAMMLVPLDGVRRVSMRLTVDLLRPETGALVESRTIDQELLFHPGLGRYVTPEEDRNLRSARDA